MVHHVGRRLTPVSSQPSRTAAALGIRKPLVALAGLCLITVPPPYPSHHSPLPLPWSPLRRPGRMSMLILKLRGTLCL